MHKSRLEAFSDGVFAIIITIMVLELKAPQGATWSDLVPLLPVFLSYLLSFIYVGIYWNNHHHLFQIVEKVNGATLWANMHLLFWLSMIPFVTAWVDENHLESVPAALYGFVLLMCGLAYEILSRILLKHHGNQSDLARAISNDRKEKMSIALYISGIALAFYLPRAALVIYIAVAVLWLIPDRRVEKFVKNKELS